MGGGRWERAHCTIIVSKAAAALQQSSLPSSTACSASSSAAYRQDSTSSADAPLTARASAYSSWADALPHNILCSVSELFEAAAAAKPSVKAAMAPITSLASSSSAQACFSCLLPSRSREGCRHADVAAAAASVGGLLGLGSGGASGSGCSCCAATTAAGVGDSECADVLHGCRHAMMAVVSAAPANQLSWGSVGDLWRFARRMGAAEQFLDPDSGRDPSKNDLLGSLVGNWSPELAASPPASDDGREEAS